MSDNNQPLTSVAHWAAIGKHAYQYLIFKSPLTALVVISLVLLSVIRFAPEFELDASADSLTLENDQDVAYYRASRQSFPSSDDYLVIAWRPEAPMFSDTSLMQLADLKAALLTIPNVKAVRSILDVPLLNNTNIDLSDVSKHLTSIEDIGVPLSVLDQQNAQHALTTNALYQDLLISQDGKTSAIQIVLAGNPDYQQAVNERQRLRNEALSAPLSADKAQQLEALEVSVKKLNQASIAQHQETILQVRATMAEFKDSNTLFLGGIPMIVVDMLAYISNDLKIFGIGVLSFLALTLTVIFRRSAWVIMPLFCCILTCLVMTGYLGWQKFPVTVISSNFISLLLIITMSMIIHLIVRYRELALVHPDWTQKALTQQTVAEMFRPCFYTILTTIVAFGSLFVSGIRPVIDFGIMMTIGLGIAFAIAFLLFPVLLCLIPKQHLSQKQSTDAAKLDTHHADNQKTDHYKTVSRVNSVSEYLAYFTEKTGRYLILGTLLLSVICVWGMSQLSVENRFIDYFKSNTEIFQGMSLIDQQLGGTTPLDIIIDVNTELSESDPATDAAETENDDCFLDDECLEDVYADSTLFTLENLDQIKKLHQFLDSLPETGKIMSLHTTLSLIENIKGAPIEALELAFLDSMFPDSLRDLLLKPFVNEDKGQLRLSLRVRESDPNLRRQELLDKIQHFMVNEMNYNPNQVHFTSMVVLYNNMLQSLFRSQIATIGVVFISILVMFILLFRSLELAIIGIMPNLLAAGVVLGLMGLMKIPLDMMTITIAAITVGIAVDDTIHYLYRFKTEFVKDRRYIPTMWRSHRTIGSAMYYTSVTIIFGFSILALSNFNPTIYFGLLTSLAMLIALVSALTLLPQLIIMFKPFGPEAGPQDGSNHKTK